MKAKYDIGGKKNKSCNIPGNRQGIKGAGAGAGGSRGGEERKGASRKKRDKVDRFEKYLGNRIKRIW